MKRTLLCAPMMLVLVVLLGLLAAGCAPATSVEAALQATETPVVSEAPAEQTAGETSGDETPADDETPVAEAPPIPDANCIACHQDAEQLQLVAEEEEVQESLSEGSG